MRAHSVQIFIFTKYHIRERFDWFISLLIHFPNVEQMCLSICTLLGKNMHRGVTRFNRYVFPVILKANNVTCTKQTPDLNLKGPQGNYLQKHNVKTKMKQD